MGNLDAHFVYTAGKTFAERETWKFVEEHKPKWDVITIHPALIIGPFLHHVDRFSELNESVRQNYENLFARTDDIPPTQVQFWVT
jgi:NADPH-dependent methylglyoxal reductase